MTSLTLETVSQEQEPELGDGSLSSRLRIKAFCAFDAVVRGVVTRESDAARLQIVCTCRLRGFSVYFFSKCSFTSCTA
jgi:hypothetical protein